MHWTEKQAVNLMLGNPGGVSLTVNGKNPVPAGPPSRSRSASAPASRSRLTGGRPARAAAPPRAGTAALP